MKREQNKVKPTKCNLTHNSPIDSQQRIIKKLPIWNQPGIARVAWQASKQAVRPLSIATSCLKKVKSETFWLENTWVWFSRLSFRNRSSTNDTFPNNSTSQSAFPWNVQSSNVSVSLRTQFSKQFWILWSKRNIRLFLPPPSDIAEIGNSKASGQICLSIFGELIGHMLNRSRFGS